MQQLGIASASSLMKNIIANEDSSHLRSMVEFVRDERQARIKDDGMHAKVLSDECYAEMSARWKKAIYDNIEDEIFSGRTFGIQIAYALSNDDGDSYSDDLSVRIEANKVLNAVYNACKLGLWTGGNYQHYSTEDSSLVSKVPVIEVLDKDLLRRLEPEAGAKLAALHIMQTTAQDEVDARDAQTLYNDWLENYIHEN